MSHHSTIMRKFASCGALLALVTAYTFNAAVAATTNADNSSITIPTEKIGVFNPYFLLDREKLLLKTPLKKQTSLLKLLNLLQQQKPNNHKFRLLTAMASNIVSTSETSSNIVISIPPARNKEKL